MESKNSEKKDEHRQSMYWRYFTEEQRMALESLPKNDLKGEINILRILMTRFIKQEAEGSKKEAEGSKQEAECAPAEESESSLRAKGIASLTIAALEKIQVNESIAHPKWESMLEEAYRQAREEMGITDYLASMEPPEETEDE